MKIIIPFLTALICVATGYASTFSYSFKSTPLSDALVRIAEDHPDLYLNFIYNELDKYITSAKVDTDNAYDALKQTIGLNPVTVNSKNNRYFVEALQHGKYGYSGRAIASDNAPVEAATVWLLSPKDSTVLTYGITDSTGRFSIPCDRSDVIAKFSCLGYKTSFIRCRSFNIGTVTLFPSYVQLAKLEVKANSSDIYSDKTIYRPSTRQKRAAHTASDLLRLMSIPQINCDLSGAVTDNNGLEVKMYINGAEASSAELSGLPTTDIHKVEYLEYPTDPRYKGAPRVINFIVQEYLYGGYTKIGASESALTGLDNHAELFSKFTYRRMSYDIYTGTNNNNEAHNGVSSVTHYRLTDDAGKDYTLTRTQETEKSRDIRNSFPISLRASYNTDKVQIRNTVGYSHTTKPTAYYRGRISLTPSADNNTDFCHNNPSITNSASYSGYYYFLLPRKFAIDVTPTFNYSHYNDTYVYTASDNPISMRHAREDAYNFRVDAFLRKNFNTRHSILIGMNCTEYVSRLKYSGNIDSRNRFSLLFTSGTIGYNFHGNKVSLNTDFSLNTERNKVNDNIINDLYTGVHLNLQYTPAKRHLLSAWFQYAANSPTQSYKTSDVLRNNEYLFITGNPNLNNSHHITFSLNYTWNQSEIFSMSAYASYFKDYDRIFSTYSPYDAGKGVIRSYTNNGDFTRGDIGVNATLRLFDNRLYLSVRPKQSLYHTTGIYQKSYNPFTVSVQAVWYLGNFYLQAYYRSPVKQLSEFDPEFSYERNYYSLKGGWSNSRLNISLSAINVFNRGWNNTTVITESEYFHQESVDLNYGYHPRLNLMLTYTIGYGKKVRRNNELGTQQSAPSSILK